MELRALGPIEASHDGRSARLGSAKERRLLALLVAQPNQLIRLEQLIDAMWDGEPPESATPTLRVHVSRFRKALAAIGGDPGVLATQPGSYSLDIGDALDTIHSERLVAEGRAARAGGRVDEAARCFHAALALWRGSALSG